MIPFCPLCASEDHTSSDVAEDGRVFVVCRSRDHGDEGFVWEPTRPDARSRRGDGLGAELDIWDKLLGCVPADGVAHPYGEVEDRFIEAYPNEAGVVWERYGHRWREGKRSVNQFSMSAYLAARLSELFDEKLLLKTQGPATGPWVHLSEISYWTRS